MRTYLDVAIEAMAAALTRVGEAGATLDNIMEWYDGLDREQVKAVIDFAGRNVSKAPVGAS